MIRIIRDPLVWLGAIFVIAYGGIIVIELLGLK